MSGKATIFLVVAFSLMFVYMDVQWTDLSQRTVENSVRQYKDDAAHFSAVSGANIMVSKMLESESFWNSLSDGSIQNYSFGSGRGLKASVKYSVKSDGNIVVRSKGYFDSDSDTTYANDVVLVNIRKGTSEEAGFTSQMNYHTTITPTSGYIMPDGDDIRQVAALTPGEIHHGKYYVNGDLFFEIGNLLFNRPTFTDSVIISGEFKRTNGSVINPDDRLPWPLNSMTYDDLLSDIFQGGYRIHADLPQSEVDQTEVYFESLINGYSSAFNFNNASYMLGGKSPEDVLFTVDITLQDDKIDYRIGYSTSPSNINNITWFYSSPAPTSLAAFAPSGVLIIEGGNVKISGRLDDELTVVATKNKIWKYNSGDDESEYYGGDIYIKDNLVYKELDQNNDYIPDYTVTGTDEIVKLTSPSVEQLMDIEYAVPENNFTNMLGLAAEGNIWLEYSEEKRHEDWFVNACLVSRYGALKLQYTRDDEEAKNKWWMKYSDATDFTSAYEFRVLLFWRYVTYVNQLFVFGSRYTKYPSKVGVKVKSSVFLNPDDLGLHAGFRINLRYDERFSLNVQGGGGTNGQLPSFPNSSITIVSWIE